MQADLYIRGGTFDQTLLLIDGFKVEDAQTGHHTMNMAIPMDVVERINLIKKVMTPHKIINDQIMFFYPIYLKSFLLRCQ